MLSYEHSYHAGNHADLLKHAVFSLILQHLKQKDTPFTVIDSHAGNGVYSLEDERAQKTGEAQAGVLSYLAQLENVSFVKEHYKAVSQLEQFNDTCKLYAKHKLYAGSPEIARCLLRKGDELILSELHPQTIEALKAAMQQRPLFGSQAIQPHIHYRNGFELLAALPPPKRGVALVDPSFEELSDFTDCTNTLCELHKKWKNGIIALWYPLTMTKGLACSRMRQALISYAQNTAQEPNVLDVQLTVRPSSSLQGNAALYGSGMLILQYPYLLDKQLEVILPFLAAALGGAQGKSSVRVY